MRSIAKIAQELDLDPAFGLTSDVVERSRQTFGENRLTPLPRESIWKKFLEKFDDSIIKILLAAAVLSMVVDLFMVSARVGGVALGTLTVGIALLLTFRRGAWFPSLLFVAAFLLFGVGLGLGHVLVEGLAVMIAVLLATGVAFASEYKSDREFELLNAQKDSLQSKVLRDGQVRQVTLEAIVVGDLVLLETGDEIPADGRILKAIELSIDQSLMTGESEAVRKMPRPFDDTASGPDQPGCVYRGTQVVDGAGQMVITAVGDATYLGQIARRLSAGDPGDDAAGDSEEDRIKRKLSISKELTPLQVKLTNLAGAISKVGYVAAVLIFLAQLLRGIFHGVIFWPHSGPELLSVFGELLDYLVTMVIIIVVAVPEGLPMSVTVSLALAMRKMTRANSLVRQLVACETIGSATVICSDKTGTLTQNKMQVDRVSWGDSVFSRDGVWPKPPELFTLNAAVNSTANLDLRDGKTITIGNSTEGALLQWLRDHDADYTTLRRASPAIYQIHFSSERKRMTTVVRHAGQLWILVKGAPEFVLSQCTRFHDPSETSRQAAAPELTDAMRAQVAERIKDAARQAMRTLAFAYAPLPDDTPTDEETLHERRDTLDRDLVFLGFVAIRDPLRHDVRDAIHHCRQAGIQVKMITGDNVETARSIAHEIGLVASLDEPIDTPGARILTSRRFNEATDEELKQLLPALSVLARAQPLDKYRMVRLLQELGEVVAVTGDGTNDAPALKKADVGLAMGIAGTEVSKEASKIVLLDDAFSTIVKAVHWGRSLYENIQRFLQFQLTINVSALAITFLGVLLFDVRAPFTVLQMLWINVIMDTFAAIALCSEPPRAGLMRVPPKRRDEGIVTPGMGRTILMTSGFFVAVMLGLLVLMKGDPDHPGLLAKDGFSTQMGAWDVEVASSRVALTREQMDQSPEGKWLVAADAPDPTIRGLKAVVHFTVFQTTLFFSIYVMFQVWNMINCRSLTPRVSGLSKLFHNRTLLLIAGLIVLGQVVIVSVGGAVFKTEPLGITTWFGVVGFTASVLVFGEATRWLRSEAPAKTA